jgi:transcriptional regulator with XRE-family HTH domain
VNPAAVEALMLANGLSVTMLAERAEVHRTYISNIIAGRRQPSAPVAKRIAEGLHVPLDAIRASLEQSAEEAS